jgi:hypothetical protein
MNTTTNNFDLNIKNYKKEELKNMFDLPDNYNQQTIDTMEARFKNGILTNKKVSDETKAKTLYFLSEAKKVLSEQVMNFEESVKTVLKTTSNYTLMSTPLESNGEHMVQARDKKPYFRSLPREYFEGVINPIVRTTIHQNLNIDTRFRDNYYGSSSSNFHVNMPLVLSNILNMQLVAIELPTTFYTISKQLGNNFFTLSIDDAVTSTTVSAIIIVPDGNYTNDGIVNVLNTLVLNISTQPGLSLFQYILFGINLTNGNGTNQMFVGLDSTTPPNTITSFTLNFQADLAGNEDHNTPLPLKLGWILGFRNGIYENNINYVSEGAVDLIGPRYLYLVVDDYNNNVNNSFYSAFNSSILNKNILARITLQRNSNNQLYTQNNFNLVTLPRQYFGPVTIQKLQIQLLDEYGRILFLNNMDYSFSLKFDKVYDI